MFNDRYGFAVRACATASRSMLSQGAAALVPLQLCWFAYFVTGYYGAKLPGFEHAGAYWLANALLLALLLLQPLRWWGVLLLSTIAVHVLPWMLVGSLPAALHWILINNEGVTFCVAGLLRLASGERHSFERLCRQARNLPGSAWVACGALLILGCLWVLDSQGDWQPMYPAASLVGFVTVTPAVMIWLAATGQPVTAKDVTGAVLTTLLVASVWIIAGWSDRTADSLILHLLPILAIWAGVSFGRRVMTTGLAVVALLLQAPLIGHVAAMQAVPRSQLHGLQVLLFVIATGSLLLARLDAGHSSRMQVIRERLRRTRMAFKNAQAQLRTVTERQELTLRATTDVIFHWNAHGDLLRWSANGTRFFGPAPRSRKAWPLLQHCIDEHDRDRVLHDLRDFMTRNEPVWQTEFTLRGRDDVHVPVRVRGIVVRDAAGNPQRMLGALSDMTDSRVARESARALARAARLAAIGEITAAVTHEVSQPISAILNHAETALLLLRKKQASSEAIDDILEDIRNDALRASEVVRRTRALLQDKEMVRGQVNLNKVVVEAVDALWLQAQRRGIALTVATSSIPLIHADAIHLQQVVINLIGNALDATETHIGGARRVEVVTFCGAGKVVVCVRDTGRGIAPERLETIFESFHTDKPEGLGLGLSIARAIVKAHGGRIFAENNQYGPGATVSFEVPVPAEPVPNVCASELQRGEC